MFRRHVVARPAIFGPRAAIAAARATSGTNVRSARARARLTLKYQRIFFFLLIVKIKIEKYWNLDSDCEVIQISELSTLVTQDG